MFFLYNNRSIMDVIGERLRVCFLVLIFLKVVPHVKKKDLVLLDLDYLIYVLRS